MSETAKAAEAIKRATDQATRSDAAAKTAKESTGETSQVAREAADRARDAGQSMQHAWLEMMDHSMGHAAHKPPDLLRCKTMTEVAKVQRDFYPDGINHAFGSTSRLLYPAVTDGARRGAFVTAVMARRLSILSDPPVPPGDPPVIPDPDEPVPLEDPPRPIPVPPDPQPEPLRA